MRARFIIAIASLMLIATRAEAVEKVGENAHGKPKLTWWGHAAFILETPGGATIAIDPWLDNPSRPKDAKAPAAIDAVLVTHGHFDHAAGASDLAKSTGAIVIGSYELTAIIGAPNSAGGNVGGSVRVKDATVTFVEAVHSSSWSNDQRPPFQYAGPPMGFVIAIDKGPTIYHAGDTDVFASMALIAERWHPDVALLPIGGHYTMDPKGAALAARLLKVKSVVPMHFGTFPILVGKPEELRTEMKKLKLGTKVVEMKPGETIEL